MWNWKTLWRKILVGITLSSGDFKTCQTRNRMIAETLDKIFAQKLRVIFQFCVLSRLISLQGYLDWIFFKQILFRIFKTLLLWSIGKWKSNENEIYFFATEKHDIIIIFQFVCFRARARNGISRLLLLCWKTFDKPYYRNKKSQELWWLWAFVLLKRQLC